MAFVYPVVTITGSAVEYPVFISVEAADDYLFADIGATAWQAGSADEKARWLVGATRVLKGQPWASPIADWPSIPAAVEAATAELASAIAGGYDAANRASTSDGVKRQKAGSVEIEYFGTALFDATPLPLPVWRLIVGLLGGGGSGLGGAISSGTCGPDNFAYDSSFVGQSYPDRDWD